MAETKENCFARNQLFLLLLFQMLVSGDGACQFPDALRGFWISSEKGELNFTDNAVLNYPLNMFNNIAPLELRCIEDSNENYLLRSVKQTYHLSLYICLELHLISEHKFWYQIGNSIDASSDERVFPSTLSRILTIEEVCNRTEPYETSTFNTLVKKGSSEQGLTEMICPQSLYHTFTEGTISSVNGASCSNNKLDVCEDRSNILITYGTSCQSASFNLADAGSYLCLLDFTDEVSGVTYLHMWNNDSAPTESLIYCMAFQVTDKSLIATVNDGSCKTSQTAESADGADIKMKYNNITRTCQDREEVITSMIGLYAGAAGGGLVFIILLVLLAYCIYKTRCRCISILRKKSRIGNSEKLLTSSQEDVSVTSLSKDDIEAAQNGKLSIFAVNGQGKNGSLIPDLHPPTKVELLYHVEPKLTCSKAVFDSSVFLTLSNGPPRNIQFARFASFLISLFMV